MQGSRAFVFATRQPLPMMTPMRHYQLDRLRLISAYAVIALHICALYVTSTPVGSAHWWAGNAIDSALRWCVPLFVMITGALLVPKLHAPSISYYRKRAGLLIPFAFWIAAYLAYHFTAKNMLLGEPYDLIGAARNLFSQPPHYHLWYLYMIVPLLFMAPFLVRLARKPSAIVLILALTVSLQLAQLYELLPRTALMLRWLEFIGYFLAGHWLFTHKPRAMWALLCGPSIALIAALTYQHCASGACTFSPYYDYHGPLVVLMSLALFAACLQWLPSCENKTVTRLTPLALGIYLIHPVVIDVLFYLIPFVSAPLIMLPLFIIFVALVSTIAAMLLNRIPYLRRVIQLR
jgi:surface polysaccharide O-acyltransferase-like enzyme